MTSETYPTFGRLARQFLEVCLLRDGLSQKILFKY
uniref:Uncharacterized protein n=1 Tax=Rhizophora mucronata TaxID=61149 RepID=A0A2P2NAK1_RHIMU